MYFDVFFINASLDGSDAGSYLKKKLEKISTVVNSLEEILSEIAKYENIMSEVENQSGNGFADEIHINDTIKEMYVMPHDSTNTINQDFNALMKECIDEKTGVKLDLINGSIE